MPLFRPPTCLAALLAAGVSLVSADVLKTTDGRRFEGKALESLDPNDDTLRFDAMVAGIRVTLRLPRNQIASLERAELPADFFKRRAAEEPTPRAKPDLSSTLYLEVPIVGRFGEKVLTEAVARSLLHAMRVGVKHIVFVIDSDGGDIGTAQSIEQLLRRYSKRLEYHAVVREALDEALLVTVWCKHLYVAPGARIGAKPEKPGHSAVGSIRSASTVRLVETAFAHGQPGELIGAMVEAERTLVVWEEPGRRIYMAPEAPKNVSPDAVLLRDGPETRVTLGRLQAVRMGLARTATATPADIGTDLKLKGWKPESDYGYRSAQAALEEREASAKSIGGPSATYAETVELNTRRRQATQRYIEEAMVESRHWDPNKARYSRQNWLDPNLTPAGRKTWRDRTDLSLRALKRARLNVIEMQRLEDEARRLNLAHIATAEQLDKLKRDIETQIQFLLRHRDRRSF